MRPVNHGRPSSHTRPGQATGNPPGCLYWPDGQTVSQETADHRAASERMRAAAPAPGALAPGHQVKAVDSMEVRWIFPGALGSAVREWFGRFPAETETREDTYLVFPPLEGLSLKF